MTGRWSPVRADKGGCQLPVVLPVTGNAGLWRPHCRPVTGNDRHRDYWYKFQTNFKP
jgi:hypothetical protein